MKVIEIIIPALSALVAGGGLTSLFYFRLSRRLKSAEANKADTEVEKAKLENELSVAKEWKDIASERERRIDAKDKKIDDLYLEISGWRDKYNKLAAEAAEKDIAMIQAVFKTCNRRGCADREPQTGF